MLIFWPLLVIPLAEGMWAGPKLTLADVLYNRLSKYRLGNRNTYFKVKDSFI